MLGDVRMEPMTTLVRETASKFISSELDVEKRDKLTNLLTNFAMVILNKFADQYMRGRNASRTDNSH